MLPSAPRKAWVQDSVVEHSVLGNESYVRWTYVCDAEEQGPAAELVAKAFAEGWVSIFGPPEVLITDGGPEFKGAFTEACNRLAIFRRMTDAHAPWQNGRTERKGGFIKRQVSRTAQSIGGVQNLDEQKQVVYECLQAANRFYNRSGFSPMQRVFGVAMRLPRSLTSDDPIDPYEVVMDSQEDFQRAHDIRMEAMKAFIDEDARLKLGRAARGRNRTRAKLERGDLVVVYRRNNLGKVWQEGFSFPRNEQMRSIRAPILSWTTMRA